MKRVGVLIPQTNLMVEKDIIKFLSLNQELLDKLGLHFSRIHISTRYKANKYRYLEEVYENLNDAKGLFGTLDMDLFCFMCTSSIIHNKKIDKFVGYPETEKFIDPLLGVYEIIKDRRIRSILIISPYDIEYSQLLEKDIQEHTQIGVITTIALNIDYKLPSFNNERIHNIYLENEPHDLVFIPCTNFDSLDSINSIESIGKTLVINSNTATIYLLLKRLTITTKINDKFGKIFI